MKSGTVALAAVCGLVFSTSALAQSAIENRLTNMERRIQYLEKRVTTQDAVIVEKDREIAKLKKAEAAKSERWFNKTDLNGTLQLQASHTDPYTGASSNDAIVKEATIGLVTHIHDWVTGEIGLKYEEDETPLEVDVAMLTIAPPDGPWNVKGGQFTLPFGTYETALISDTLPKEMGETRETAVSAGFEANGFVGTVFAFNGTNKKGGDSRIRGFGAVAGYAYETEANGVAVNAGYINDLGDSDAVQDTISDTLGSNDVAGHVGGWIASGKVRVGPVSLTGEYVTAVEDFEVTEVAFRGTGARPSAWAVETAYGFKVFDKDATVAVSYQGTDEALAMALPERRFLAGFSVGIIEHVTLLFEWSHDWDYSAGDGGTGNTADTVKSMLAVEF